MRNPARNIGPGGHALRADQVGHVVKGHHIALKPAVVAAPGGHADQQVLHRALPGNLDLAGGGLTAVARQGVEQRAEFRHRDRQRQRLLRLFPVQKPHGRAVDEGDAALGVEPHNAGGDRAEHGIEEPAAAFNLAGVVQKRFALALAAVWSSG